MYGTQNSRLRRGRGSFQSVRSGALIPPVMVAQGLSIHYCSDAEFSLQHHAGSLLPHPRLSLSCRVLLSLVGFEKKQR